MKDQKRDKNNAKQQIRNARKNKSARKQYESGVHKKFQLKDE